MLWLISVSLDKNAKRTTEAARMKKLVIFFTVVPLMIGIFLLTRRSIPEGQISLVWALVGTGLLIATFLVIRLQKPK